MIDAIPRTTAAPVERPRVYEVEDEELPANIRWRQRLELATEARIVSLQVWWKTISDRSEAASYAGTADAMTARIEMLRKNLRESEGKWQDLERSRHRVTEDRTVVDATLRKFALGRWIKETDARRHGEQRVALEEKIAGIKAMIGETEILRQSALDSRSYHDSRVSTQSERLLEPLRQQLLPIEIHKARVDERAAALRAAIIDKERGLTELRGLLQEGRTRLVEELGSPDDPQRRAELTRLESEINIRTNELETLRNPLDRCEAHQSRLLRGHAASSASIDRVAQQYTRTISQVSNIVSDQALDTLSASRTERARGRTVFNDIADRVPPEHEARGEEAPHADTQRPPPLPPRPRAPIDTAPRPEIAQEDIAPVAVSWDFRPGETQETADTRKPSRLARIWSGFWSLFRRKSGPEGGAGNESDEAFHAETAQSVVTGGTDAIGGPDDLPPPPPLPGAHAEHHPLTSWSTPSYEFMKHRLTPQQFADMWNAALPQAPISGFNILDAWIKKAFPDTPDKYTQADGTLDLMELSEALKDMLDTPEGATFRGTISAELPPMRRHSPSPLVIDYLLAKIEHNERGI